MIFNEYRLSLSDMDISPSMLHNKRLLDYGGANGLFLDFLFLNGCSKKDLFIFDVAQDLLKEARDKGYNLLDKDDAVHFDYIFLWDVLEHCTQPKKLLKELKIHLKNRGRIVVQTPRVGMIADLLKENWEHFIPIEHQVIYSRNSLIKLFEDAGFKLLKVGSFGGNAPLSIIPQPYKNLLDNLAKRTDNGSTQVAYFELKTKGDIDNG